MTIDIDRTQERSTRYAERIVKDFGRAAGVEGRTIRSHHLAALTEHIARVRKKRPTRKSGKSSWTPEVWLLLAGVPDAEIAEAVLTGVLNATATERKDDDQTAAALRRRASARSESGGW